MEEVLSKCHCLVIMFFLIPLLVSSSEDVFTFGAVGDSSRRAGIEERIAIGMAVEDFNTKYGRRLITPLYSNSLGNPTRAAYSANNLIRKHQVRAIIGSGSLQESAALAEVSSNAAIPIISLSTDLPNWTSSKWPFLIKAAHNQLLQAKAAAAIVQSWQWRRVNVIYEDRSSSTVLLPSLISALHDVSVEVDNFLALPPFPTTTFSLSAKLRRLQQSEQCRVFIVHASPELASAVFLEAKELGMMGNESVWIVTAETGNYVDTLNASTIASMEGVLALRTFFPTTKKLEHFQTRFKSLFHKENPNDHHSDPGIFALRAYDAVWALGLASNSLTNNALLSEILNQKFTGLSGKFEFTEGSLEPSRIFGLVNIVGKSYREIGYWTDGLGFSVGIGNDKNNSYSNSMAILGQIYWPGGAWSVPRGWGVNRDGKKLIIGVPTGNTHKIFVFVERNETLGGGNFTVGGWSVEVFKLALKQLPYDVPYEFQEFNGTYDELVLQIKYKRFDAVVADTAIVAKRCEYAEFSQPYSESGLIMVKYVKPTKFQRARLITQPFTLGMWVVTMFINLNCGFALWLIERQHNEPEFREGDFLDQLGIMLALSFATLFSLQGRRLRSNWSRMILVLWFFVALVVTQTYTASLTNLLTEERHSQVDVNIETLVRSGARVGCDANSFVVSYLEQVLGFRPSNIVRMQAEDDYSQALMDGQIEVAFLEAPYVKVFLSNNCKDFATAKQTFQVGGFGFVFPKNHQLVPDISEAIIKIVENGQLRDIEDKMLSAGKCSARKSEEPPSPIGLASFWILFTVMGCIANVALIHLLIFPPRIAASTTSADYSRNIAVTITKEEACNNNNSRIVGHL